MTGGQGRAPPGEGSQEGPHPAPRPGARRPGLRPWLPNPHLGWCRLRRKVDSATCLSPVCPGLRHPRAEEPSDPGKGLTRIQLQPPLIRPEAPCSWWGSGPGSCEEGTGTWGALLAAPSSHYRRSRKGTAFVTAELAPGALGKDGSSSCGRATAEVMGLVTEQEGVLRRL